MIEKLLEYIGDVKENEPLAPYTTFKIGGPARYFFVARSADDLMRAIGAAKESGVPWVILGGGSNILVADKGFDGLAILTQIKGVELREQKGRALVTAGAGENWDDLVAQCVARNWAGIECLSGIPGTVGAAPVQNIGAYGQTIGVSLKEVRAIDCKTLREVTFSREGCAFGYRDSMFKKNSGRYIIAQATLVLTPGGKPALLYHDLKNYFVGRPAPTLLDVRKAVIEIRARKGYVIMPGYESYKTAGSFFLNPNVSAEQFQKIQSQAEGCAEPWHWLQEDGKIKVSAACLLQSAGFPKGFRKGKVGISPKHPLSLMNYDGAKAKEIVALADEIKKAVWRKFGIELKQEAQLVGF